MSLEWNGGRMSFRYNNAFVDYNCTFTLKVVQIVLEVLHAEESIQRKYGFIFSLLEFEHNSQN
jgi:hypothetical protein